MPGKPGAREVLYPSDPTSPEEALHLADSMVLDLQDFRTQGELQQTDAQFLMYWKKSYARDPDKLARFKRLRMLRFGDLHITGGLGDTGHGHETLEDGRILVVPKSHVSALCGCGCHLSAAAVTLQRRVTTWESRYYGPVDKNFDLHEPGITEQPYVCPHIGNLLMEWFHEHRKVWKMLRNRLYSTNLYLSPDSDSEIHLDPEWLRTDIGFYNFVHDVGMPPGGMDTIPSHKLRRYRIRGYYTAEAYYWQRYGEPEKPVTASPIVVKKDLRRMIYTRFHSAKQRAVYQNHRFSWETFDQFWDDITNPKCPLRARLPRDFAPHLYKLRFDYKSRSEGLCLKTLYWEKATEPNAMAEEYEQFLAGFEAGVQMALHLEEQFNCEFDLAGMIKQATQR